MIDIGKTLETGTFRAHRYASGIVLTDLTNAGKRGKRVSEVSLYDTDHSCGELEVDAVAAEVASADSFASAEKALRGFASTRTDRPCAPRIHTRELRGVDVAPVGSGVKTEINGDKVFISVEWDSFTVRCKVDQNNFPTLIPRDRKVTSVAKFRALVKTDADALKAMTFSEVWNRLSAEGIDSHYFCSMD